MLIIDDKEVKYPENLIKYDLHRNKGNSMMINIHV